MPRCLSSVMAALALAVHALVSAQTSTQVPPYGRAIPIPVNSLRGEIVFGQPPEITIEGKAARLAPGARIRDLDNRLLLSGSLTGQKAKANYTVDTLGLVMNIWLLSGTEAAQLWPKTAAEAATWSYDPVNHLWSKP